MTQAIWDARYCKHLHTAVDEAGEETCTDCGKHHELCIVHAWQSRGGDKRMRKVKMRELWVDPLNGNDLTNRAYHRLE